MHKKICITLLFITTINNLVAQDINFAKSDDTSQLVEISSVNDRIICDIRYATTNNFAGKRIYPAEMASTSYLHADALCALNLVQEELEAYRSDEHPEGLGLKVFDGYRPYWAQVRCYWMVMPEERRYWSDPEQVGGKHTRGTAVDLTMIDRATGKEVAMPSKFDELSELAHRTYTYTTDEQRENAQFLEAVMVKYGFIPLPHEWWHYDFKGWEQQPILTIFPRPEAESAEHTKKS